MPNADFPVAGFAERMHMWGLSFSLVSSIVSWPLKSEPKGFKNSFRCVVSRSLHFFVSNGRFDVHERAILAVSALERVGDDSVVQRVNTVFVRSRKLGCIVD